MGIEDIFLWYQHKIGTYDKQLWETKIEQREQRIYSLNHVQMRSGKPNTELIDLDLVRGSSFTKAKPQQGFMKVAKLATFRCLFLPFYGKWWLHQTSRRFFVLALSLYLTQIINAAIYYNYCLKYSSQAEAVSCMEIFVPLLMAWILTLIHSQMVATIPDKQDNRRRRSGKKLQFKDLPESLRTESGRRFSRSKTQGIGAFNLQFNSYLVRQKYRLNLRPWFKHANVDDDGFESLNGSGSRASEEEIVPTETSHTDKDVEEIKTEEKEEQQNADSLDGSCLHCKKGDQKDELNDEPSPNCTSCKKCEQWVQQLEDVRTPKVCSTDTESEGETCFNYKKQSLSKRRSSAHHLPTIAVTSVLDSTCDTENEALSSPRDWAAGVTTNSEDCSSDLDDVSDAPPAERCSDCFWLDGDTNILLNPPSVKATCTIWERNEIKKADLTMLDISSAIIAKVDTTLMTSDYFYAGIVVSAMLALLPCFCQLSEDTSEVNQFIDMWRNVSSQFVMSASPLTALTIIAEELPSRMTQLSNVAWGSTNLERAIIVIAMIERFILACIVFFLLAVAERTFKQRLLYAKLFSHLTSSRRARKSGIPHFRLNKVRNIKTWLSVRSYLKKRGPQRSVDVIVSSAFVVALLLLGFLCAEVLKETVSFSQYYLEAIVWCLALGIMLLRFMTLGIKINKKYRNLSVLITEQINLHVQMEQKPHKKEELTVANNVLKLAIDLLKELENPFKISGFSANPILYNVTKLVILSALSGVLSEMLGFKLKLHKIKIK
ncbi:protein phtf isoform X2 [Cylas formicarius]|uniref:protein phtf isoform X2 n=1 Tax=Cylas formicarius TaxID=197179 RepID=UPI0029586D6A|nr:protein phtf isoform X2 [Cylas formicarius]